MSTIFKSNSYSTTHWSGGSTNQLFIYPKESNYTNRDFDLRISIATINQTPSEFTLLPNYKRILILLDGKVEIYHEAHEKINLGEYQTHQFDGSWKTHSIGLAKDFNVIFSNKIDAKTEVYIYSNLSLNLICNEKEWFFLYLIEGALQIGNEDLKAGDSVLINENKSIDLKVENKIILVSIKEI